MRTELSSKWEFNSHEMSEEQRPREYRTWSLRWWFMSRFSHELGIEIVWDCIRSILSQEDLSSLGKPVHLFVRDFRGLTRIFMVSYIFDNFKKCINRAWQSDCKTKIKVNAIWFPVVNSESVAWGIKFYVPRTNSGKLVPTAWMRNSSMYLKWWQH